MTASSSHGRGGGPSPSQVQDRAAADPAGLDRPDDQARLEGALDGYDIARRNPPNPEWRANMMTMLRERDSRSATSGA
jgi:hypothetical protein